MHHEENSIREFDAQDILMGSRGKVQIIYLTSLCKCMAEEGVGGIVKRKHCYQLHRIESCGVPLLYRL